MLRCRRCRKGVIDETCLAMVEAADEGSAAVCSIRHVNVDTLPEWILTSVQQAQWTVGKLNCQNCGARLGRFNFIDRSECPCGRDATVHLNKSRVDWDHKRYVLLVQPRTTGPGRGHARSLMDGSRNKEEEPDSGRTAPDSVQPDRPAVTHHTPPTEASTSLTHAGNSPSFPFSPLYCISHRRRHSSEDDATIRSSCFCAARHSYRSAAKAARAGTGEFTRSAVPCTTSHQFNVDGASFSAVACRSSVSGGRRVSPDRQLLQTAAYIEASAGTGAAHEELPDSGPLVGGRSTSDSAAEQEEEPVPQASVASQTSNRLSKREKNRLKSLRRKQKRRERWLHSQLEQEQEQADGAGGFLLDSDEEDREGLTCVVCLDVYFSPHSCQPCSHVFCEPCLRTLAKNRPTNTPCPLCRTLISHTNFHKELNQRVKTCFPKVYYARKQHFQNSSCVKWPLPSCRKRFRTFWGYPGQTVHRRLHFSLAGFTLDALDLADIHSVNWVLAFLLFCFLMIYFYF